MLHPKTNVKRRHIYALVLAIAMIITVIPVSSWAAHQFIDVPNDNIFHDDIGWLADNGITLGCNPAEGNTKFCPEDNVTRQQMAAFMRRLAENQVVDAKTAIDAANADNADKLDGKHLSQVLPVIASSSGSFAHGTSLGNISASAPFEADSVTITAPHDGVLKVTGSTGWELGNVWFTQWLELNEATPCDNWNSTDRLQGSGVEANPMTDGANLTSIALLEAPAGTHVVSLCLWPFSGSGSLNVSHVVAAEWIPTSSANISGAAGVDAGTAPAGGPSGG